MTTESASLYKVKTASFEGPLELLLSLIENKKLFVNDLSLSEVTNDYISYVRNMSDIPQDKRVSDISYFILVASTLILIKSKSLLPNLSLSKDEEEKIVDLESRLSLYKIIKDVSAKVKEDFGQNIYFAPMERNFNTPLFSPDKNINSMNMLSLVNDVLQSIPQKSESLPEIEIKKVMSIDEMINSLTDRIQSAVNLSFRDFAKSHVSNGSNDHKQVKVHVIVSFLAMLELVREGVIDVIQNNHFEDMSINKN